MSDSSFFRSSPPRDPVAFKDWFFGCMPPLAGLRPLFERIRTSRIDLEGRALPAMLMLPGRNASREKPFLLLCMLHGNEPAGLAGALLAMALAEAGLLDAPVTVAIGNPLAASQYFEALARAPHTPQETRDVYRCGLDEAGRLLKDMNRIPEDFAQRDPADPHTRRAQELYRAAAHASGILDIHSARGNMVCVTDHLHDSHLRHSPIRNVLMHLAEAIAAHSSPLSGARTVTFKTIAGALPHIRSQTGIEAGRHEDPAALRIAAEFTLALFHTLGLTSVRPVMREESGAFLGYEVKPRLTYADLRLEGELLPHDRVFMARATAGGYVHHQYEEMEPIAAGQVVAVAEPSGAVLRAPFAFSGIFLSKSAALYDRDPAVGPWPVAATALAATKFCYPCAVVGRTLEL